MKNYHIKTVLYQTLTLLTLTACGGDNSSPSSSVPSTTSNIDVNITETNITIRDKNITETIAPAKPTVSNVPKSTVEDEVTIELSGEVGATVWINGKEIDTIDSDGKINITLDTSGEVGSKTFSITLKNSKGQESEALVILVEKENAPTPTTNSTTTYSSGGGTTTTPVVLKKGVLLDSAVAGVSYRCGTKTGKTDENGTFECSSFPAIFTILDGKLEIGRVNSMSSDSKVFIQDLAGVARDNFSDPKVLKLAKLLQSLDDDGNYTSTITIDDSAIVLSDKKNIDDLNMTEVEKMLTDNGLTIISDDAVVAHLIDNADNDVNKTIARDKYAVLQDKETLTLGDNLNVNTNLTFPTIGEKGSSYTYVSSLETVLSSTGVVHPQSFVDGNKSVTITATISKGTVSDTKVFVFNVVALPITDLEAVTLAKTDLTIEGTLSAIDSDLTLKTVGLYGTTISWSSSSYISSDGKVTRPSFTEGNQDITLIATITKGSESITKEFMVKVLKLPITDAESVANVKASFDLGDTSAVTSNLTLPTEIDGVTITWSSSGDGISDSGVINPDNYQGVNKTATLTATLIKGDATDTKEFTVTILKLPMSDIEAVALAKKDLGIGLVGDELLDITEDITLPTTVHNNGVVISWESNNTSIVSNSGVVNRPSYTIGSTGVTLKATLTKGSVSDTKEIIVFVRPLAMTGDEIIADAYNRLGFDDIKGANSSADNIVSNLNLPSNLIVDNGSNVLIKWESNPSSLIDSDGTIHAPTFSQGDANVKLIATIGVPSSDNPSEFDVAFATVSKSFDFVLVALDMSDAEAVALDKDALSIGDTSSVTESLTLPITGLHDTTITYVSSNEAVLSNGGIVARPSFGEGDATVTLTATISRNGVSDTKSFIVVVVKADAITADLANVALYPYVEPIVRSYGDYTFEVRTDGTAPSEATQKTVTFFGKTSVTGLEDSDTITFAIHREYASGTNFQLIIKNSNGNIIAKSEVLNFTTGMTDIGFGTILFPLGGGE